MEIYTKAEVKLIVAVNTVLSIGAGIFIGFLIFR